MKVYQLFKTEIAGGTDEYSHETELGYFSTIDNAVVEAEKHNTTLPIVVYYPKLNKVTDLNGDETKYPYCGFIIKEIEINEYEGE